MICKICGTNNATMHIKSQINGEITEVDICNSCAAKLGYGAIMNGVGFDINQMLSSLLSLSEKDHHNKIRGNEITCTKCGESFNDIINSGKAGCANCYVTFYDKLLPVLQRIHGKTQHSGKLPSSAGEAIKLKYSIEKLKKELNAAVEEQDFEKAASLRDEIKEINERIDHV